MDKIYKFMYGRYGLDEFNNFLFKLYIFLFIANIFFNNKIIFVFELLLMIILFSRFLSKNINSRKKENKIYLKYKKQIIKPFITIKERYQDKEHVYKKCHHCKTILKLPRPNKIGIKHSKCPNCKKRLCVVIFRKKKIEIIKNKKGVK